MRDKVFFYGMLLLGGIAGAGCILAALVLVLIYG